MQTVEYIKKKTTNNFAANLKYEYVCVLYKIGCIEYNRQMHANYSMISGINLHLNLFVTIIIIIKI